MSQIGTYSLIIVKWTTMTSVS